MTVRRGAVSTAAALLIGSASLGCSGGDNKAAPLPSLSRTPTPSIPAFPKTPEGAAAFARYYFDVSNQATATGSVNGLESLALASCQTCARYRNYITQAYANGGRIAGGELLISSAVAPQLQGDRVTVSVIGDQKAGQVLDRKGHVSSRIDAVQRGDLEVTVQHSDSQWLVAEINMRSTGG